MRQFKHKTLGYIASFGISNPNLILYSIRDLGDNPMGTIPLWALEGSSDWEEIDEKPLFLTTDGVPYYANDKSWSINDRWDVYASSWSGGFRDTKLKTFSTQDKAIQYKIENQPIFSVNDFRNMTYFRNKDTFGINLLNLAKKKLNL